MKILIASDSYKGSLGSLEVGEYIKKGFLEIFPESTFEMLSMADGGEGTVQAIVESLNGTYLYKDVYNPLQERIQSHYGKVDDIAIIEMASASGLPLVKEKRIKEANTYGTGELILDALNQGCKHIYMGIGGSATNDGGIGMASALGIQFLDKDHQVLNPIPENLPLIEYIDNSLLDKRLKDVSITVMCDVSNPLCGKLGASAIYGPQKGATSQDVEFLDSGLLHLADICKKQFHKDYKDVPGAGAAGGLGFGLMTFLDAKLNSGIETILDLVHFDDYMKDCNLVITGEGRIDHQSIYGKVPTGVALRAKKFNVPTIAIVGSIGDNIEGLDKYLEAIESCVVRCDDLDTALKNADMNVYHASKRIASSIKLGMKMR